jgi:alpha-tubulin suppressor-like RCC1 family protein
VSGLQGGVQMLSAGGRFSCAVLVDGTIDCWGANDGGQLGTGGSATDFPQPVRVAIQSSASVISAGELYACAILANGSVQCWGSNLNGQLGTGNTTDSTTPVPVIGW